MIQDAVIDSFKADCKSNWSACRHLLLALCLLLFATVAAAQNSTENQARNPNASTQSAGDPFDQDSRAAQDLRARERLSRSADRLDRNVAPELEPADDDDADSANADQFPVSRTMSRQPLSAERIIGILQEQPELLASVKRLVADRAQRRNQSSSSSSTAGYDEQWQTLEENSITDDALYSRIEQDPELRVAITQRLRSRGVIEDAELEDPAATRRTGRPVANIAEDRATDNSAAPHRTRRTRPAPEEEPDATKMHSRLSPYPTLPSLKDLYSQYPSLEAKPKRFGSEIFRVGTGNANDLPMDIPVGPDYVLGPGDGLTLNLWGSASQRLTRNIDRQGQLALPEVGAITLAGQTIAQAQEAIQKALSTQFQNIRVEISLARLRTVRIYVVGDVQRPGSYDISSLSTPLNALYAAGGPTSRGSLRTVRHYRGKQLVREVDLYDFILRGTGAQFEHLQSGDTIMVPPIGSQVAVVGMVRRPAIYEIKDEHCLKDVLELAGGVLVSANLRQVDVARVEAHQRHTMLSVRLPEDGGNDAVTKALSGFTVQDGDRVIISPILPYNERTVYLQGHVFRPGKYSYHDGMTVNELLRSYQDLLPEPAEHAEIVRLQPPDFRPSTITFSLSDILGGDDPIDLQPFDVVRIFSRYEIDPPKVAVYGDVLRPGEYPLAAGMTAAGLVRMAGGFKRSAFQDQADLSSYVIKDGSKVLTKHSLIDMRKALDGDPSADAKLQPGDVVTIRQLTGWKDIGAAVSIKGEVRYAGTYGIQEGERLSSVLKRAGGFRDTAYPAGAVLERIQVRDMAEKSRLELIRRVENAGGNIKAGSMNAQEQLAMVQAMQQQQQQVLASLRSHPATGRLVIKIGPDVSKWEGTPADIEMRAGDVLVIPKRPNFVLVSGQVYSPAALTYAPGKLAEWYLKQAGGPTDLANKKAIFIVRADGSVVGHSSGNWWGGNVLSVRMQPGDTIVVPDKVIGGSVFWKNLMSTAQLMSSVAMTAAVTSNF